MIINAFFCSLSSFFFSNIFTFLLFAIIVCAMWYLVIKKCNDITKIAFLALVAAIVAGGLVVGVFLRKEDPISDTMVSSYYLGVIELLASIAVVAGIILSAFEKDKKKVVKKKDVIKVVKEEVKEEKKEEPKEIKKEIKKEEKKEPKRKTVVKPKKDAKPKKVSKVSKEKTKTKEK